MGMLLQTSVIHFLRAGTMARNNPHRQVTLAGTGSWTARHFGAFLQPQ